MSRIAPPLVLCVAALLALPSPEARAETFRSSVVVERPAGMARRLADLEVDAAARTALVQAFIGARLSESLLTLRGDRVRTALEPVTRLIDQFAVLAKEDLDATRVRVTCEGDIDAAAIVLQLVSQRILTFAPDPPRVLLMPAAGTAGADMQALRGRIAETLGAAGVTLLAAEAAGPSALPANQAAIAAASELGADFVGLISFAAARAPSAVGGVVLDGTLQYTLIRPHDAVIVAERVFNERGSGSSDALASRAIMDSLAGGVARSLGAGVAEAIFASGAVIDPARPAAAVRVNVYARPDAAATNALISILRSGGVDVSLGRGVAAGEAGSTRQPADQLIVDGDVTIERLYDLFATAKFGERNMLRASVFEYGEDHIGLEILDSTPPTVPPAPRPVAVAVAAVVTTAPAAPAPAPSAAARVPAATAAAGRGQVGVGVAAGISADAPPLQLRLSTAFASRARKR